ncbi:MAG: DUF2141 domain-containing protein [Cyclobacteriaceae bacterium]|jgi:uncharacterized protein (DUF2141 family)
MNILSLLLAAHLWYAPANKAELKIKITGFKDNGGKCVIMLFKAEPGFPKEPKNAVQVFPVVIQNKSCELTIPSLDTGTWAVSVFHDANENGEVDTNFLGIPKEGIGVSKNVIPAMRAPRFDECRFQLTEPKMELQIQMKYI